MSLVKTVLSLTLVALLMLHIVVVTPVFAVDYTCSGGTALLISDRHDNPGEIINVLGTEAAGQCSSITIRNITASRVRFPNLVNGTSVFIYDFACISAVCVMFENGIQASPVLRFERIKLILDDNSVSAPFTGRLITITSGTTDAVGAIFVEDCTLDLSLRADSGSSAQSHFNINVFQVGGKLQFSGVFRMTNVRILMHGAIFPNPASKGGLSLFYSGASITNASTSLTATKPSFYFFDCSVIVRPSFTKNDPATLPTFYAVGLNGVNSFESIIMDNITVDVTASVLGSLDTATANDHSGGFDAYLLYAAGKFDNIGEIRIRNSKVRASGLVSQAIRAGAYRMFGSIDGAGTISIDSTTVTAHRVDGRFMTGESKFVLAHFSGHVARLQRIFLTKSQISVSSKVGPIHFGITRADLIVTALEFSSLFVADRVSVDTVAITVDSLRPRGQTNATLIWITHQVYQVNLFFVQDSIVHMRSGGGAHGSVDGCAFGVVQTIAGAPPNARAFFSDVATVRLRNVTISIDAQRVHRATGDPTNDNDASDAALVATERVSAAFVDFTTFDDGNDINNISDTITVTDSTIRITGEIYKLMRARGMQLATTVRNVKQMLLWNNRIEMRAFFSSNVQRDGGWRPSLTGYGFDLRRLENVAAITARECVLDISWLLPVDIATTQSMMVAENAKGIVIDIGESARKVDSLTIAGCVISMDLYCNNVIRLVLLDASFGSEPLPNFLVTLNNVVVTDSVATVTMQKNPGTPSSKQENREAHLVAAMRARISNLRVSSCTLNAARGVYVVQGVGSAFADGILLSKLNVTAPATFLGDFTDVPTPYTAVLYTAQPYRFTSPDFDPHLVLPLRNVTITQCSANVAGSQFAAFLYVWLGSNPAMVQPGTARLGFDGSISLLDNAARLVSIGSEGAAFPILISHFNVKAVLIAGDNYETAMVAAAPQNVPSSSTSSLRFSFICEAEISTMRLGPADDDDGESNKKQTVCPTYDGKTVTDRLVTLDAEAPLSSTLSTATVFLGEFNQDPIGTFTGSSSKCIYAPTPTTTHQLTASQQPTASKNSASHSLEATQTEVPLASLEDAETAALTSSFTSAAAVLSAVFAEPTLALEAGRSLSLMGIVSVCSNYGAVAAAMSNADGARARENNKKNKEMLEAYALQYLRRKPLNFGASWLPTLCFGDEVGACYRGAVLGGWLLLLLVVVGAVSLGFISARRALKNSNRNGRNARKAQPTIADILRHARLPFFIAQATAAQLNSWLGAAFAFLLVPSALSSPIPSSATADLIFLGLLPILGFFLVPAFLFFWFLHRHGLSREFHFEQHRHSKHSRGWFCDGGSSMPRSDAFQLEKLYLWWWQQPKSNNQQQHQQQHDDDHHEHEGKTVKSHLRSWITLDSLVGRNLVFGTLAWSQGSERSSVCNGAPGSFLRQCGSIVSSVHGPLSLDLLKQRADLNHEADRHKQRVTVQDQPLRNRIAPFNFLFASLLLFVATALQTTVGIMPDRCEVVLALMLVVAVLSLLVSGVLRPFLVPARNAAAFLADFLVLIATILALVSVLNNDTTLTSAINTLLELSLAVSFTSMIQKIVRLSCIAFGVFTPATASQVRELNKREERKAREDMQRKEQDERDRRDGGRESLMRLVVANSDEVEMQEQRQKRKTPGQSATRPMSSSFPLSSSHRRHQHFNSSGSNSGLDLEQLLTPPTSPRYQRHPIEQQYRSRDHDRWRVELSPRAAAATGNRRDEGQRREEERTRNPRLSKQQQLIEL